MSVTRAVRQSDLRTVIALIEKDARIYTAWARAISRDNAHGQRDGDIAFLKGLVTEHDEIASRLKLSDGEDEPPAAAVPVPVDPQPDQPAGEVREEVVA